MSTQESKFSKSTLERTNVCGHAVNGKCIIKATMDMEINQLHTFEKHNDMAAFKNVVSKKMTLEAVSTDHLKEYLGMEVILEPHLKVNLGEYRISLDKNPRSVAKFVELLKNTKGKYKNDLVEKHVVVEVWEYYSVFESDLRFILDNTLDIQSDGYLIPELVPMLENDANDTRADEVSILDIDITNVKAKSDNVDRIIIPNK